MRIFRVGPVEVQDRHRYIKD